MTGGRDTAALLRGLAAEVETHLDRALPAERTEPTTLHRAMRHAVMAGGKRLRPALALLCAEACGGPRAGAMPVAAALEMIHTYSLVHDDLPCMDDDALRRGQPTVHVKFGEALAVLAGDALLTLAFTHLGQAAVRGDLPPERLAPIVAALGDAAGVPSGMVAGQVLDLEGDGGTADEESLRAIHRAKTGRLIEASCVCGAHAAGATEPLLGAFRRHGQALGLAFQITDDILDATATSATLGKTAGKDAAQGKATYVALHGLEKARAMAEEEGERAKAALDPLGAQADPLRALADFVIHRDR